MAARLQSLEPMSLQQLAITAVLIAQRPLAFSSKNSACDLIALIDLSVNRTSLDEVARRSVRGRSRSPRIQV